MLEFVDDILAQASRMFRIHAVLVWGRCCIETPPLRRILQQMWTSVSLGVNQSKVGGVKTCLALSVYVDTLKNMLIIGERPLRSAPKIVTQKLRPNIHDVYSRFSPTFPTFRKPTAPTPHANIMIPKHVQKTAR